jgi:hypothetical protein
VRLGACREIVINAGSREIEVKELTVMPCRSPLWEAVTMVTPVVHARMAARNCSESRIIVIEVSIVKRIILSRGRSVKTKIRGQDIDFQMDLTYTVFKV